MVKKILKFIDNLFKSSHFAIIFMISIGIVSIYGTIFPPKTPFDFNLYKTPFYLAMLLVFAINVAYCTYFRIIKVYRALKNGSFSTTPLVIVKKDVLGALKDKGFNIKETKRGLLVTKGIIKKVSIICLHVFIVLLIIIAGLSSYYGFLGTVNIHEKGSTNICFSWNDKADVSLPFSIMVKSIMVDYYPMQLKIEIEDSKTNKKREVVTREGGIIELDNIKVKVLKGLVEKRTIVFTIIRDGVEIGPFDNEYTDQYISFKIKFLAYIEPIPKQFYAYLNVKNHDKEIDKVVSINNPLVFDGYRIYLIDTGVDDFGFPYAGLQITYEPLITLIWVLCILIVLSLMVYPFVKEEHLLLAFDNDRFIVYVWKNSINEKTNELLKQYETI